MSFVPVLYGFKDIGSVDNYWQHFNYDVNRKDYSAKTGHLLQKDITHRGNMPLQIPPSLPRL